MGTHGQHFLLLALLALLAAASAALQDPPQSLLPGYGKEFRPFVNYNGIPIAARPSPWIRAAEIQRADAPALPGERPRPVFEQPPPAGLLLQRGGPQFPVAPPEGALYQRVAPPPLLPSPYSSGNSGDQSPPVYEHSMLLIDHPPEQRVQQQQEQQPAFRSGNSGDQSPPVYEHSMLLIDHPPEQIVQQQQEQQAAFRSGNSGDQSPPVYEHSMLLIDHPPEQRVQQQQEQQPAFRNGDQEPQTDEHSMVMIDPQTAQMAPQQGQPDQQAIVSGDAMAAESPAEETVQEQGPPADQQPSAQESGQEAQPDTVVPQRPVFMPYQQGPRPFGFVFQSGESYPGLSPPPAYQLEQMGWGVQPAMQVPVYPNPYREQPSQPEQQPRAPLVESPRPVAYYPDDFQVKGGYQPFLNQRQAYDAPRVPFGSRPFVVDRSGMVPPPPGGVAPFPMPSSYLPETPAEEAKQDEAVPDKDEQSESHESEKSKSDSEEDGEDKIESKVKALKDAADVEEEVVPALVVFLRKKGHKAFHDKDSVGIPGKEERFRRSPGPGIGSGSSSHSSSSSSSSSGPVYFGDGGGSYSSSSSQSSASSSSGGGGGAPLGVGASGPGLGGAGAFYGGGHVPPSGFGVSDGGGGGYGNNGYGNAGYGNTGYGNTGYGNAGYGNSGYGGGAVGGGGGYGGGYGGGVGPSGGGGGGCASCGDDSNVLLNRFGEADGGGGPFTVGGGGASKGQGVHSSASSSIDSTGKVTYTAFAGKH